VGKKSEGDKTQDSPAEQPAATPEAAAPAPAEQAVQTKLDVDDSNALACYANFCRVSSTPEEMILDLGLNPQPMGIGEVTINVSQRIIMNHYTAKRLLSALSMALQRHEQAFGVLETDVRKRVKQQS
jgi:hypothetical protein